MNRGGGLRPTYRKMNMTLAMSSLEANGVRSGDSFRVQDLRKEPVTATVKQGKGWEYPPSVKKTGKMERKQMPRDNSCLFHSISYVSSPEDGTSDEKATAMRILASEIISTDPQTYDQATLGMSPANYVHVVTDPQQWGGGIELQVFSRHFEMEITAFDYHFLREDIFGQGGGYKKRAYLIYTGDHYDVMTWRDDQKGGSVQKTFSPKDLLAWQRARDLIQSLHSEASKNGRCKLQSQWRREIKKRTKNQQNSFKGGSGRSGTTRYVTQTTSNIARKHAFARRPSMVSNSTLRPTSEEKDSLIAAAAASTKTYSANQHPPPSSSSSSSGTSRLRGEGERKSSQQSAQRSSSSQSSLPSSSSLNATTTEEKNSKFKDDDNDTKIEGGGGSPKKRVRRLGDDAWDCPSCTYRNNIIPDRCQVCRRTNPNYQPDPRFFPGAAALPPPSSLNDSETPQQLIGSGGMDSATAALMSIDPSLMQQLQLASIPAWICPQCRVLNRRGTIRCALPDCQYPNPVVSGAIPPQLARRQQALLEQQRRQQQQEQNNDGCLVS